jgi:hypothetical protein
MSSYEIKLRLEGVPQTGRIKELASALNIYSHLTPIHDRTDTNEIIYWSERYNKSFDDELVQFIIYADQEIIGFSQCVHFKSRNIVVIDYVTIDEKGHDIGLYVLALQIIIRHFLASANVDFFVTELTKPLEQEKLSADEFHWQETLKLTGFKTAQAPYRQPKLGLENYESNRPGYLVILPTDDADTILKETFISIVRLIYFDHYFRWYEPFLKGSKATYTELLQKNISEIEEQLEGRPLIRLNGTKGASSAYGFEAAENERNKSKNTGLIYLACFAVLLSLFIALPLFTSISFSNLTTSVAMSYAVIMTFIFLRNRTELAGLFDQFQKIRNIFGK